MKEKSFFVNTIRHIRNVLWIWRVKKSSARCWRDAWDNEQIRELNNLLAPLQHNTNSYIRWNVEVTENIQLNPQRIQKKKKKGNEP